MVDGARSRDVRQAALRTFAANLGQLLINGQAAAPGATIVVTSNCDPFLAR